MKKAAIAVLTVLCIILSGQMVALAQDPTDSLEPPPESEIGEPIRDENYVSGDDVVDEEGGPIDIFDLSFVAGRFGTDDPAADLNLDGTVNILDLSLLASAYGDTELPAGAAAIPAIEPLPEVGENTEFGSFDIVVEPDASLSNVDAQAVPRTLRIGVAVHQVYAYDRFDSTSHPDFNAVVTVGNSAAKTSVAYNLRDAYPNWGLGWWRYNNFPWAPDNSVEASYYSVPLTLEIRDYDGRICYGYYGCRDRYERADVSPLLGARLKHLKFYPSDCVVTDEISVVAYGSWTDSDTCRVSLQSWGTEWPRAYVRYTVEAQWN